MEDKVKSANEKIFVICICMKELSKIYKVIRISYKIRLNSLADHKLNISDTLIILKLLNELF